GRGGRGSGRQGAAVVGVARGSVVGTVVGLGRQGRFPRRSWSYVAAIGAITPARHQGGQDVSRGTSALTWRAKRWPRPLITPNGRRRVLPGRPSRFGARLPGVSLEPIGGVQGLEGFVALLWVVWVGHL